MGDMISYDVSFHPSPVTIGVTTAVANDALTATVSSVPDIGLSLSPAGNFAQKVLSAVVEPIALLIVAAVNPKPRDMIMGKSVTTGKLPPYQIENLTITASSLALGGATLAGAQYLKATAKLSVAVTPTGSQG
jgi:hypothetical protein